MEDHSPKQNARAPIPGRQDPANTPTEPAPHSAGAAPHRNLKADLVVIGAGTGGPCSKGSARNCAPGNSIRRSSCIWRTRRRVERLSVSWTQPEAKPGTP